MHLLQESALTGMTTTGNAGNSSRYELVRSFLFYDFRADFSRFCEFPAISGSVGFDIFCGKSASELQQPFGSKILKRTCEH
jgi:hypothetical protein